MASIPLIFGMFRSQMMAFNARGLSPDFTVATPTSPSSASITSYPAFDRMRRTDFRTSASSSTTSTLPSLITSLLLLQIRPLLLRQVPSLSPVQVTREKEAWPSPQMRGYLVCGDCIRGLREHNQVGTMVGGR